MSIGAFGEFLSCLSVPLDTTSSNGGSSSSFGGVNRQQQQKQQQQQYSGGSSNNSNSGGAGRSSINKQQPLQPIATLPVRVAAARRSLPARLSNGERGMLKASGGCGARPAGDRHPRRAARAGRRRRPYRRAHRAAARRDPPAGRPPRAPHPPAHRPGRQQPAPAPCRRRRWWQWRPWQGGI